MPTRGKLWLIPIKKLYDRGVTVRSSSVLEPRLASPKIRINSQDAERLGIESGNAISLSINGSTYKAPASVEERVPKGQVIVDRSSGVAVVEPVVVELKLAK